VRLTDNHYLVSRRSQEAFEQRALPYVRGRLVDIGCGDKPLEGFLAERIDEYVGVDFEGSLHGLGGVDVVATAYDTKQADQSFDTVLCTTVLEHLEEPEQALREAHRILKPGGCAIYTVPLFWHLHEEPRDFYRYTKYGLRYLFEKTGFEVILVYPCSGFWVTFGSEFNYYVTSFSRGLFRYVIDAVKVVNNLLCYRLDKLHKAEKFTWMYLVVARKPGPR